MPAKSKSQQRLFGMVHAYNKGELKGSKSMKKYIGSIAKGISDEDARHFAETSHKGLPEKKADDYKIEPYTGKDLDDKKLMSLVKLFKELDAEERLHDRPYGYRNLKEQLDLNYVKDWLKNKSSGYLASDKDNNIIGYGTNECIPGERSGFISNLVINNKHRNKGIGRKILKRIIKDNIKRNLDTMLRVSLNNPEGMHLYSSVGFIPTNQTMLYRGQEKKSSFRETALQKLSADTAIGPRRELATTKKPFPNPDNNPGKMRYYAQGWFGELPKGLKREDFTRFKTPYLGLRAASRLLNNIGKKTGKYTISSIMPVYSPKKENNTAQHISNISKLSGLGKDQVIDPNNIGQRVDLLRGLVGAESGHAAMNWFRPVDYTNAVLRANQSL